VLKKRGFIREGGGGMAGTMLGVQHLGNEIPEAPQTPEEVIQLWRTKLSAGPLRMFDALVTVWKNGDPLLTREALGEATNYAATGGTFSNYLSLLRRNKLIVESKEYVKLNEEMFPT